MKIRSNQNDPIMTAIHAALGHFKKVFPAIRPATVALEEFEMSPDKKHWLITFGFFEPAKNKTHFWKPSAYKLKVVKLNAKTLAFFSVKNRNS